MGNKEEILDKITNHYLESDFNGTPISHFKDIYSDDLKKILIELINERKIDIITDDNHPNPFIKAFPEEKIEKQIERINNFNFEKYTTEVMDIPGSEFKFNFEVVGCCLYPSREHLKEKVDINRYISKPYTLQLALGYPELDFASFEMRILEEYRNDPRYYYKNTNISGSIHCKDEDKGMKESDNIFLETFGFSFNKSNLHRNVAVFIRYLSNLSSEHQLLWKAKEVNNSYFDGGDCFLHPVYSSNSCGHFTDEIVIFDAITDEIFYINEMCKLINEEILFRNDYRNEDLRPKEFSYLIRPTKKEYYSFIHCLDKILSDNMNIKFFEKEKLELKDGEGKNKGTIQLLQDYFSRAHFDDREPVEKVFTYLKNIRKLRQKPGHSVIEDEFDYKYLDEQKKILNNAYYIVRFIRLILTNHPNVRGYKVPNYLYYGDKIINY